jgi:hypothetical protein
MAVQERGHAERLPEGQLYHPNGGAVKRESTRACCREAKGRDDILAETRATDLADVATRADQGGPRRIGDQIIKWLVPLLLGQAGLIVALIKLLP